MYPRVELRDAWDTLYRAVATKVGESYPDTPPGLSWDIDPHESWNHPLMALSQSCGWPIVTALKDRVRVVGTFAADLDGVVSPAYRSVIVAREGAVLGELRHARAAVNSTDSLSGWVSLLEAFEQQSNKWPGATVVTGSHAASLESLRDHHADVAAIDAVTWAHHSRLAPQSLVDLGVIGRGPEVPCLPLIVPFGTTDAAVEAWRQSFEAAVLDASLNDARRALLIGGFVRRDLADYEVALAGFDRFR